MKKLFLMLFGLVAVNALAVTPADPTDVIWYDCGNETGHSFLTFTLPTVDVNGNLLDIEMMGYRIYTDDDQIFTFTKPPYDDLWGNTTDVYYYLWDEDTDIRSNGVFFYRTNADGYERFFNTRIGVQVFYVNDNFTIGGVSNIVYAYLGEPVAELPKPATPDIEDFIDYGNMVDLTYTIPQTLMTQEPVADDYNVDLEFNDVEDDFTVLDPEKLSFSILTDNDKFFVFTPEMFPGQIEEATTHAPYTCRTPNGNIGYWDIHFAGLTNEVENAEERFFDWRIALQTHYTDGDQTNSSELLYMEVYPQLKEAAEVTSTSFLADWNCDAENTYILAGFKSYDLYITNMATQETTVINNVEPTYPQSQLNEQGEEVAIPHAKPGAAYTVTGLTPGTTYQYYVVCSNSYNSFNSATREVTLPAEGHGYDLGDVNHDGKVNITDATFLIDFLLGVDNGTCNICGDINGDDAVNIVDVTALIDILLGGN